MEAEFGKGWSVRKVPKEMSKNCKRFRCNQSKKIKKLHLDERYRKRPMDIPVKVWKELVKYYEKLDAQKKAGNESIQVLYFPFKIYLNLKIEFSIIMIFLIFLCWRTRPRRNDWQR